MSITEKSKEFIETVEEKVEQGVEVVKETLGMWLVIFLWQILQSIIVIPTTSRLI